MNNTIGNKTFQLVWSNFDICHEIASYCNPTDLLTFEIINSICYKVLDLVITIHKSIHIQYIQAGQVVFSEFRHSSYYKYLIYRQRADFNSDKRICSRLTNNQRHQSGGILVFGGTKGNNSIRCVSDNRSVARISIVCFSGLLTDKRKIASL